MNEKQYVKMNISIKALWLAPIFLLFFLSSVAKADSDLSKLPSGQYTLDKTHASIVWKVSHLGLSPYVARFTDFDIDLFLDSEDLSKSSVSASVNAASVSTENKQFNKKLIGKAWFKSGEHPKITFISTAYKPSVGKSGKLLGTIEMFGIKKPVEFDVTIGGTLENHPFIADSAGIGFLAKAMIKRSDWGFSKFVPTVGDEVTIEITAEFSKNIDENN